MSCVNHIQKYIFIHIAKTGGTSMGAIMPDSTAGHDTLSQYKTRSTKRELFDYNSYYKWCFVRNPWDRAVSAYGNCPEVNSEIKTFAEFINILYDQKSILNDVDDATWVAGGFPHVDGFPHQRIHFLPQYLAVSVGGELDVDYTGRFETIEQDWNYISDKFNFNKKLPHARKNVKRTVYTDYYDDSLRKKAEAFYRKDIDLFGYSYD